MRLFTWRNALRATVWGGTAAIILAVAGLIAAAIYVIRVTDDLPNYEQLALYEPPIMSRVHAGDGLLIAEYARQHRVFVPIENIPPHVINAFLAAEDRNFYEHGGLDFRGIIRAAISNVFNHLQGRRLEGASTITQQVAKNFLLTSDQNFDRKIREMVLARRIERAFTKDQILELYLNEIYLGFRAYGVAAAALNYFGRSLDELELHEVAFLAALPKAPANYHPIRRHDEAVARRNWVLARMAVNGFITEDEAREAAARPLETVERLTGDDYLAAEYFVEEVRRQVFSMYGADELYDGGLSIRTTLDTRMQLAARRALRNGLVTYDRGRGWRGALGAIETGGDWAQALRDFEDVPADAGDGWERAVVLAAGEQSARIGLADGAQGTIPLSELTWARRLNDDGSRGPAVQRASQVLSPGDVVLVQRLEEGEAAYGLRQVPAVNGALMAMDPHTGRVLAMVGGYSFQQSQFNRATQARRQPGSAFKPFVYAAAMANGYTPASLILDAPFVAAGGPELRFYRPTNYSNVFYGMSTLRLGLELSRNVMTVRLAEEMGMRPIVEFGESFGVYDRLDPVLAMSLGAGETTLWRLVTGYAALVNNGRRVDPTILDRVQDRHGRTIYVHDQRDCETCDADEWRPGLREPQLPEPGEQAADPVIAYQIVYMLEGAVRRGTGTALNRLGRPLAGKTGTTNDFRDAWFVGFGPDLVAGVYIGFDMPRPLGDGQAGGIIAAPIVADFFETALRDYPVAPFRVPDGVRFVPIDRTTGEPSVIGRPNTILEAFLPGTEPSRASIDEQSGLSFARAERGPRDEDERETPEDDDLGGIY
ncbi:MAG: penicillin-binding protein 1A [Maricaulaceae bacterium]|nr:penicillin-binding protein 1A [Maricaulaceae bacterium]